MSKSIIGIIFVIAFTKFLSKGIFLIIFIELSFAYFSSLFVKSGLMSCLLIIIPFFILKWSTILIAFLRSEKPEGVGSVTIIA